MKGTIFQKPLQLNLSIDGESWHQGDAIAGSLTVKNHGSSPVQTKGIGVRFAYGQLTKVREKAPGAFHILSNQTLPQGALDPQQETQLTWKFETERNSPITDKTGSLYLLYGEGDAPESLGSLQLILRPHWVIEEILKILQIEFRFVLKTQKSSKGFVESKFAPPAAKEYSAIEQLLVSTRFTGEALDMRYSFAVKKLSADSGVMELKKDKKDFQKQFQPVQYLRGSRLNHEQMENEIREVLNNLGLGKVF